MKSKTYYRKKNSFCGAEMFGIRRKSILATEGEEKRKRPRRKDR
jgi:hypothetical protein